MHGLLRLAALALLMVLMLTQGSRAQLWGPIFNWGIPLPPKLPAEAAQPPHPENPTDWLPPLPANKPYDTCVCAFDFDGVLRAAPSGAKDQDTPAPDAPRVVNACKSAGWEVAICSANDDIDKQRMVLGKRLEPSVFTPEFFDSSAFQMHYDNKSISLFNLIRYFDTAPQCIMFFDDRDYNAAYAQQTGVLFFLTPRDTGITYNDFLRAQQSIGKYCNCAKPEDRSYNDFSRQPPDRSYLESLKR